jgi:Uncharacterized protein conserved in bacteria
MKKTVKTTGAKKQPAKTAKKKAVKTVKTPKKRAKKGGSDALRAGMLTGILIVAAAVISIAVINFYKSETSAAEVESSPERNKKSESLTAVNVEKPEQKSVAQSAAQSETRSVTPTLKETPAKKNAPAAESTSAKPQASLGSKKNKTNDTKPAAPNPPAVSTPVTNSTAAVTQRPPAKSAEKLGTVVFIIDDAGNNLRELDPFLRVPGPLTIAVLPGLPHSAEAAKRIRAAGKEVFLHQPMEAIGGQNPGPGAIYSGMSAGEIRAVLKRNVDEIGPITGMNNHQGSKITMDTAAVETILAFCAENDLLFLDSRTTADTVVPGAAQKLGIKIGERDTFIDNEQDKESMIRYIVSGLAKARKTGSTVMIGHTWSPELAPILAEQYPKLIEQGYTIKTAGDIIKSK